MAERSKIEKLTQSLWRDWRITKVGQEGRIQSMNLQWSLANYTIFIFPINNWKILEKIIMLFWQWNFLTDQNSATDGLFNTLILFWHSVFLKKKPHFFVSEWNSTNRLFLLSFRQQMSLKFRLALDCLAYKFICKIFVSTVAAVHCKY